MSRTLAIGDIHGCRKSLESLVTLVDLQSDDRIVFLGDYVDRGPDSRGVIDFIIELSQQISIITLKGNHEIMMLEAREIRKHLNGWLSVGGAETLDSYQTNSFDKIPKDHWSFLNNLQPYFETDSHLFVHANLYPDCDLCDQPDYMLYWERLLKNGLFNKPAPHYSGKQMICGHTSQKTGVPLNLEHSVCIDTYAYGGGWLTCLDVNSGYYWQTNEKGQQNSEFL